MSTILALVAAALFVVGFRLAKVLPAAQQAIARVQAAAAVLADGNKTDLEKEQAARHTSMMLFGSFFLITALTGLSLVPPAICVAIAAWAGLSTVDDILNALVSAPLIVAAIVFFLVDYVVHR